MVFRLYGKISPHPGEIPPLVRWDFTIPVVLRSSCKREMKIQRILLEGGISPLSPGSGKGGVFPHINRALDSSLFLHRKHITSLNNLPSPVPSKSLHYLFNSGHFCGRVCLNSWLRELLLSAFANSFKLRCELKQPMLLYYKIYPY